MKPKQKRRVPVPYEELDKNIDGTVSFLQPTHILLNPSGMAPEDLNNRIRKEAQKLKKKRKSKLPLSKFMAEVAVKVMESLMPGYPYHIEGNSNSPKPAKE